MFDREPTLRTVPAYTLGGNVPLLDTVTIPGAVYWVFAGRVMRAAWQHKVWTFIGLYALLILLGTAHLYLALAVLLVTSGLYLARTRRQQELEARQAVDAARQAGDKDARYTGRFLSARRILLLSGFVASTAVLLAAVLHGGWGLLADLAMIGALWVLIVHQHPDAPPDELWSEHVLVAAFKGAGAFRDNDDKAMLSRLGTPRHDEYGTTVTFSLSRGYTYENLLKNRTGIAGELELPERRFQITHDPRQSPKVVTLWFGADRPERDSLTEHVDLRPADRAEPVEIGPDDRGRPLLARTRQIHVAILGATRAGKTWLARWFVRSAVLDPTAEIVLLDFKDNLADWSAMHPRCTEVIAGCAPEEIAKVEPLLDRLLAISDSRKTTGLNSHPLVVVVDEWYLGLTMAASYDIDPPKGPRLTARLEKKFSSLAATCSARNIQIVFVTQRGTTDYFPPNLQVSFLLRMVGRMVNARELYYALDLKKEDVQAMPTATDNYKEFLVQLGEHAAPQITVPHGLSDEQFAAVCAQGVKLREQDQPDPAGEVQPMVPATPEADELSPLAEAAYDALVLTPGVTVTALLAALPEAGRPAGGIVTLGKELRLYPDLFVKGWGGPAGKDRVWTVASGPADNAPTTLRDNAPGRAEEPPAPSLHARRTLTRLLAADPADVAARDT